MKFRFLATVAALGATAILTACGGGGGSNVAPLTLPVATPTVPTPTPSPYPSAEGAKLAYAGSIVQTFTRFATPAPTPTDGSTPQPTATPWVSTSAQSVSQSVIVHANATFNSATGLTELDTHEVDAGQLSTLTIDSKDYASLVADASRSNGMNLAQSGSDSKDSNGVEVVTALGASNGITDELPQVPGSQWSNTATRTVTESDPGGETVTNTYAADGTYNGTVQYPEGGNGSTIVENADGSGMYIMPLYSTDGSEITYNAPVNGAIGITVKDYAQMASIWGTVPVWFNSVPPVLAGDDFVDSGLVTLPKSCNVPPSIGTQAMRIDEKRVRLDAIFGEFETLTQSDYVIGPYGVICTTAHDDLVNYYDFTGQSATFGFSGTPIQETVTDETLGLQSGTGAASSARKTQSLNGGTAILVRPSLARIQLTSVKRHLSIVHSLISGKGKAQ